MKALPLLCLLAVLGLTSCGSMREARPLSRLDRERGPLVLDGPERERPIRRNRDPEKPGPVAKVLPWNWF